ncbi:hypothetical protein POM88_027533 [Heracleum sosnowskyi]|uniref:Uncharacterized protein n=1 Tax=Heracleum sosnowskyi TaxID=360622 RepID=A0AAD8I960_9APIA|nr:hypothetical protein POM88_027533 [Heracleum sosnowskyi]
MSCVCAIWFSAAPGRTLSWRNRIKIAIDVANALVNFYDTSASASSPGAYFSASDPVLVSSQDSRLLSAVGTIKCEISPEQISLVPVESKSVAAFSDVERSLEGKTVVKSQVIHKNQLSDSLQAAAATHSVPSSNYSSRTAQVIGPQKAPGRTLSWRNRIKIAIDVANALVNFYDTYC